MKFKAVTLLIILLSFIATPSVMYSLGKITTINTIASIQEEEEVHKHIQLDAPDLLIHNYKKHLFILQIKSKKLIPYYSFSCCNGFLEYHCPPPEFSQYIS
ncbi:MAG: hypothetical protein RL494_1304 [Bacteroidota bacterium]|jgi:recombinational DNA repair protein (RecF pathway)